jgi:hypothetical protein
MVTPPFDRADTYEAHTLSRVLRRKGVVLLELEIKHKHGGFNINYEKVTVVWQQFSTVRVRIVILTVRITLSFCPFNHMARTANTLFRFFR